jgi:large subunit ribosomal protein L4
VSQAPPRPGTTTDVRTADGSAAGSVELDAAVFGVEPNPALLHQVVTGQLAAARAGTQSTKTRAEVRGGGAKPWRQKGTGRARQGSTRAPNWTGGGMAHALDPRSHRPKTPKKMVQLALRSALSDRAGAGRVVVVDSWTFTAPKTREARVALSALGVDGRVLVVVGPDDVVASKSFRNLPDVHVLLDGELNAYDVLCSDWVVFTRSTLPGSSRPDEADDATAAPAPEPPSEPPSEDPS